MFTTLPFTSILGPRRNFRDSIDPEKLKELEASILEHGLLQNIIVTPDAPDSKLYRVVAGERRWTAIGNLLNILSMEDPRGAVLQDVPSLILEGDAANRAEEAQLVENLQREDISPLTEARGFQFMIEDRGYTLEKLAERIGKSRAHVSNRLQLLKAPKKIQEAMSAGVIGSEIAAMVARVPHAKDREELASRVLEPKHDDRPMTHAAVTELIRAEYMVDLRSATWDLSETFQPGGCCETCLFRSGNNPELAGTLANNGGANDHASSGAGKRGFSPRMCLKPSCFRERTNLVWARDQRQAEDGGVRVLGADLALKIFCGMGGTIPADSAWADLDDKPGSRETGHFDSSKVGTWGELLSGIEIETAMTRHPGSGKTHYVVDRAAAVAAVNLACEARGEISPFAHSSLTDRETARADARRTRERAKALKDGSREALQAVCDHAELVVDERELLALLKSLILAVLTADGGALGMFAFWLGADATKAADLVRDLDTAETALGFLSVALLANQVRLEGLAAGGLRLVTDALEIDLDAMIKRAEAAADEACKDEPTAAERAQKQMDLAKQERQA